MRSPDHAPRLAIALAAALLLPATTAAQAPFDLQTLATARTLRDRGLADDTAWETLRSLTTEIGPRLAGSPEDTRAVAWAEKRLKALGFQRVRAETVTVPRWVRGEARAEIVAPWPQKLVAVALGGSPPTPPGGIEAEIVPVTSIEELKTLDSTRVRGRIVFFDRRMVAARDGSGYGPVVAARSRGPDEAAKLGALGVVIRSVGTSKNRVAHTGGMRHSDSLRAIPALAISNPDADMLERQLASNPRVRVRIFTSSRREGTARSANVIGEITGRERPREIVLLGAHLDSWDLGTGAHDDGAGVAIVTSAAHLVRGLPRAPRRTIRVVLFANEEWGGAGSDGYAKAHPDSLEPHVICMESDLGAFPAWGFASRVPPDALPVVRAMHALVEPLGLAFDGNFGEGGADLEPLRKRGVPVLEVETDAIPYFDLHHTANDTFDKVEIAPLRQNVAIYAALAYLAAEVRAGFGRLPPEQP